MNYKAIKLVNKNNNEILINIDCGWETHYNGTKCNVHVLYLRIENENQSHMISRLTGFKYAVGHVIASLDLET